MVNLELQDTKVSTKGVQRLIIIPKDQHHVIDQLKDVEYVFEVSICETSSRNEKLSLRIIGKVSKMGGQRQIFIPIRFHKDLKKLKDKKYLIIISIQEIQMFIIHTMLKHSRMTKVTDGLSKENES